MSISAMKQAMEALALVASGDKWLGCQTYEGQMATSAYEALSQAIEQAEKQEPVAQYSDIVSDGGLDPRNTAPAHASDISQEPVDETAKDRHEFECPRCGHCCREWVGLTDDEIVGMTCECVDDGTFNMDCAYEFACAIEAELKEKNCECNKRKT